MNKDCEIYNNQQKEELDTLNVITHGKSNGWSLNKISKLTGIRYGKLKKLILKYNLVDVGFSKKPLKIGEKFFNLTILSYSHSKNGRRYYRWKCDCGKIKIASAYKIKTGEIKSCGCVRKKRGKWMIKKVRICYDPLEATIRGIYSRYREASLRRDIPFLLLFERAKELFSQNCYFCGIEPKQNKKIKRTFGFYEYNGIDRLKNAEGYSYENCVSCCRRCNLAKSDMSEKDFFEWISRVNLNKDNWGKNLVEDYSI